MIIEAILSKGIISSEIVLIRLPRTRSRIIQQNKCVVYCSKYDELHGLFRKDIEETRVFGRQICDRVASIMKNQGFFTTDECPEYGVSYGLSTEEYATIFNKMSANRKQDLVVLFAYPRHEAKKTKEALDELLTKVYLRICS